jgi:peptidoglycan/LPS O-acetylase OafA/YrhL
LAVVTLIGAFIIGPLATTAPLSAYFSDHQFIRYLRSLLLYPVDYALPGVFHDNPLPVSVNGSIWTLPMEFAMYLIVCSLGATGFLRKHLVLPTLSTAIAVAFAFVVRNPNGTIFTMEITELSRCAFCFFCGALLAALRGRIVLVSWAWIPILTLIALCHYTSAQVWMILLLVPYAAISFAVHQIPYVHRAGRFGDCSYGVYIYAWLIQQSLMHWMPDLSLPEFLILATALSFALGFASWHLVEKRALRLKHLPIMRRDKPAEPTPTN